MNEPPGGPAGPVTRPQAHELLRTVRLFALLMICSVLVSGLELPWSVAALGLSVAAVVVGTRALVASARLKVPNAARVGIVVGLALAVLTLVLQLAVVVSWPLQWDYQQCRASALTEQAQDDCRTELEERIEQLRLFTDRSSSTP